MRVVVAIAVLLGAAPAGAEVTRLGGLQLGQKARKPTTVRTHLYGCAGVLRSSLGGAKKVVQVKFSARNCTADAVAAALTKQQGRAPVVNAQGDRLWEGKTASVILSTSLSTQSTPILLLVPPGAGSKRTCWPDDGFAPFWATFKAAVSSSNPSTMAASFVFPARDYEGTVMFATARDFANSWSDVIDHEDATRIASGELAPTCRVDGDRYRLILESGYYELDATKVKGVWRWSSVHALTTN